MSPWKPRRRPRSRIDGSLVVLSGLPGAGKSVLADELGRRLGATVLSVDPIEAAIWRSSIEPSFATGLAAYEVAAVLAQHQLGLGLTVIADAVNSLEVAREMWRRAARTAGAQMCVVQSVCSDAEVHRRRLLDRVRSIEGFPEPSWDEVVVRRDEWEEWQEGHLVLDSLDELGLNVERALAYLSLVSESVVDGQ